MNYTELMQCVVLAFATAALSITLSKSELFRPFRRWIRTSTSSVAKAAVKRGIFEEIEKNERVSAGLETYDGWLYKLISCPYCVSHWVAAILVAIYTPRPVPTNFAALDYVLSWLVVISLASLIGGGIYRAYE